MTVRSGRPAPSCLLTAAGSGSRKLKDFSLYPTNENTRELVIADRLLSAILMKYAPAESVVAPADTLPAVSASATVTNSRGLPVPASMTVPFSARTFSGCGFGEAVAEIKTKTETSPAIRFFIVFFSMFLSFILSLSYSIV